MRTTEKGYQELIAKASETVRRGSPAARAASLAPPKRSVTDVLADAIGPQHIKDSLAAAFKPARKKPGIRVPKKKFKKPPATVQIFFRLLQERGLPAPIPEYRFFPSRKWRMDYAWPEQKVFLESQGGIWKNGGHNRGAIMVKEWAKINTASGLGWRILYCEPRTLIGSDTIDQIETALNYTPSPAAR